MSTNQCQLLSSNKLNISVSADDGPNFFNGPPQTSCSQTRLAAALPVRRCGGFCSGPREKERQNQGATADLEVHRAAWTSCSLLRWSREEKKRKVKGEK
jgi:hypothetical protein